MSESAIKISFYTIYKPWKPMRSSKIIDNFYVTFKQSLAV